MEFINNLKSFCQRLFFMVQKELLTTLKDKRMRVMMIVPALTQGFLFGYAASYNLDEVPYAVVDMDHSEESRQLLAHFQGNKSFQLVAVLDNVKGIKEIVDSEKAMVAVVIPQNFARHLAQGENTPVQLIADGRNSSTAGIAMGYCSNIINAYNIERAKNAGLAGKNASLGMIQVESRTWYNPNQLTRWIFSPGLIAMIAFVQVLLLAGMSIAKEREQGSFDQLMVTPLSPVEILLGKAVVPMLVGVVQSTMLFLIARFWFEIPFAGSVVDLYILLLIFMLSLTGAGLMISAVSATMQQVMVYLMVLMMPMVLLSGIATPINNMPEILQLCTWADPLRFAVDGVRRIYLEGAALGDLSENIAALLAIAGITLPGAGWLFYNRSV
ncbi:MAG: ABC transporter permease [Selenomonadaceae bacterium]|nr:ABC transporter permease [Selenomonadaceae bacterium]